VPFIALYDANALYPNAQRDLLIRIARHGLVQAKWTSEILDEMCGARLRKNPDLTRDNLARLRDLINSSVADCLVTGYEPLIDLVKIRDPQDGHVLAAAIRAKAQVIVTSDRDFTAEALAEWDIEAKTPDEFLLDQIGIDDRVVYSCVQEIANSRSRPPRTTADVLAELENSGLVATAAALRTPLL
jgi:predicted nucleic acid-binding protein